MMRFWAILFAGLVGLTPAARAQSADVALNCTACHDLGVGGTQNPAYPILRGQPTRYLDRQLDAFRTGKRQHPQMQLTAQALGVGGAPAMARMFGDARQPPLSGPRTSGIDLVEKGDWTRGIAPCASCHAPPGQTEGDIPWLHGQHGHYLARQLRAYSDGSRQSDPIGRMRAYSERLTASEIDELAEWYAGWQQEASR